VIVDLFDFVVFLFLSVVVSCGGGGGGGVNFGFVSDDLTELDTFELVTFADFGLIECETSVEFNFYYLKN
jgi:hypothetical protein